MTRSRLAACALVLASLGTTVPAAAADVPVPKHLLVAVPEPSAAQRYAATVRTARLFYAGWNTGQNRYFTAALSPAFVDRTLPPGRPQGPSGPPFASAAFRKIVPDLRCAVEAMIVAGAFVTVRQRYTGISTSGRDVDFVAIDVLHIVGERIVEDWHLEDSATFARELGGRRRSRRYSAT